MSSDQPVIKKRRKKVRGYDNPEQEKRRRMDAKRKKNVATAPQSQIRLESGRSISPASIPGILDSILDEEYVEDVGVALPNRSTICAASTTIKSGVTPETSKVSHNIPPAAKRSRTICEPLLDEGNMCIISCGHTDDTNFSVTNCGHIVHTNCWNRINSPDSANKKCPYCKLSPVSVKRIYSVPIADKEKACQAEIARLKKELKECQDKFVKPYDEAATCYNCESKSHLTSKCERKCMLKVPAQTLSGGRTYVPCSVEGDQVVCGPLVDLYEHYMREKLSRVGIAILFSMTVFGDRCCGKCLSLLHNTVACKEEPPDLEVKNLAIKIKNAYSFMEEGNKKREVHMKSLRNSCTP
ncbi:uncharacterized protein LOC110863580 [Folsomia candida]|uniref:uncharacterized protein LOC110863580 n=1 Tax=Folsomia candida TaxID=158441 RepID=UPI000B8FB95C|nr:uncharacterized protein LOC110863580 [Folsomia candida]